MGTTTEYLASLKDRLDADAKAKREAYQLAYDRATQASFDAEGKPTYKKDESGQNKYGTLDINYMNQERNIGAGAEASGMMRSGQTARQYATNLAGYKADVLAAGDIRNEGLSAIESNTLLEKAKYDAMYGTTGSGAGTTATQTPASTPASTPTPTPAPTFSLPGSGGAAGGAAASKKVSASWLPKGSNAYSYIPPKPKAPVKKPVVPSGIPTRRTGPM